MFEYSTYWIREVRKPRLPHKRNWIREVRKPHLPHKGSLYLSEFTLIIFLFFGFSGLSVLGQTAPTGSKPIVDSAVPTEQTETTAEGSSEKPPIQTEVTAADEHNAGVRQEVPLHWEKKQHILKIANDYELAADAAATTLIMIAGGARLQGHVTGNVLVLGGDVELTQGSQVNGTLQVIGGQVSGHTDGVANLAVSNHWQMVPAAAKLVMHPHIFSKTLNRQANLRRTVVKSGLSLLMYLLIFALFSRPINAIGGVLSRRPIGSLLFGVLMLPLVPLVFILLTLSVVGVPFMLVALALLVPLAVFGKTAIFVTLGSTLFSGRWKPIGVIFSYILYFMATSLPYIDWVTFLLINAVSIGVCLLSGLGTMLPQDRRTNISALPNTEWGPRSERV